MRYLITTLYIEPFLTDCFIPANHWNDEMGMVVYDLIGQTYTTDGENWLEIKEDHL